MSDSYGSDDGFNAWLLANGLTLPSDAPAVSVLRLIGSSYVDAAYEAKLSCSQRSGGFEQVLAWPRKGHRVNGSAVPADHIPQAWINASYRAAYLQATQNGWATSGRDPSRVTKREKVDSIEREFFGGGEAGDAGNAAAGFNVDPLIDGMVSVWLCSNTRNMGDLFMVI